MTTDKHDAHDLSRASTYLFCCHSFYRQVSGMLLNKQQTLLLNPQKAEIGTSEGIRIQCAKLRKILRYTKYLRLIRHSSARDRLTEGNRRLRRPLSTPFPRYECNKTKTFHFRIFAHIKYLP
jgi:hypothetical protein